ncbi:MAG: S41 family peptidase [Salinivirgaceae bacterium]|jgi:hypothetical protein|nr:S41 family peptidase [Salinivirgaceae bacterium]
MKVNHRIVVLFFSLIAFYSCENALMEGEPSQDPVENFDYLWQQVNEKYSYFDVKNVNWDVVYNNYRPLVNDQLSEQQLFNIMFDMLSTLKDGHVNIVSPFNVSRYHISHNAPENFNRRLLYDYYLRPGELNHFNVREHYYTTGSLIHQVFEVDEHRIGYIHYSSFSNTISDYAIDYTLARMHTTNGLIIDVRNNGGGAPSNIFKIINRLTDRKLHIYSSRLKDGPGHNDFGEVMKVYSEPEGDIKYLKPIILITNRNCYSATSFFAAAAKAYPNITHIGDTTGGGAGAPHGGQMPNGWYYRFSVTQSAYPENGTLHDFELGVPPDIHVDMAIEDELEGHDSMLDLAIVLLLGTE